MVRKQQYEKAVEVFDEIIANYKEANYIRIGSIGLKVRYLRAKCNIALLKIREAKDELCQLKNSLIAVEKRGNESIDERLLDLRIEIDLGYCHIQRNEYTEAIDIYIKIYFKDGDLKINENVKNQIKPATYIMGLNNFLRCLILSEDTNKNKINIIFNEIKNVNLDVWKSDRETNYLEGLYCLKFEEEPKCNIINPDENESHLMAHKYFKIACGFKDGFIYDHQNLMDNSYKFVSNGEDKAKIKNDVERISAYIINLCELYWLSDNFKKYNTLIQRFIFGLPSACKLSLKAATALANWILEKDMDEDKKNQLLRSFSYIGIYEERGARAFNELKYNPRFRAFAAYNRGKLLAHLLKVYQPVKEIKETCCLSDPEDLVHYTKMSTLKILLDDKKKSLMRMNNCGYMNDIFEGSYFINIIKKIYLKSKGSKEKNNYKEFIGRYFPQIKRETDNMLPIGSNVYLMSLSKNKDSFPMWYIYSEKENGCNIEFPSNYFDIFGKLTENEKLKLYLMSNYKDTDYPVYEMVYCDPNKEDDLGKLKTQFENIVEQWDELDTFIQDTLLKNGEYLPNHPENVIYEFVADRMNEIRFLFKDGNYKYENEIRVVYTAKRNINGKTKEEQEEKTDNTTTHPRVYVNLNRRLENINVRLGSKISDHSVDKYVTWLMHTGRVKKVNLSIRNRYTNEVE